jgi:hypothetical protein
MAVVLASDRYDVHRFGSTQAQPGIYRVKGRRFCPVPFKGFYDNIGPLGF